MNRKIAGVYETVEQARQAVITYRRNGQPDLADQLEEVITIYLQEQRRREL